MKSLQFIALILIQTLVFLKNGYAQGTGDNSNPNVFPTVLPPSPNSAELGKYGAIPVSQATGNMNVSIGLKKVVSQLKSLQK